MGNINYILKVEPYEVNTGFSIRIKDVRDMALEYDFNTLTDERKKLVKQIQAFGTNFSLWQYSLNESFSVTLIQTLAEFDHELTIEEAFDYLEQSLKIRNELQTEIDQLKAIRNEKLKAENEKRKIEQRKAQQEQEERRLQAIEEAKLLNWKDGKAICNLFQQLSVVSELEFDPRFSSWIKCVNAVDITKSNGYCFIGDWLKNQTVEIDDSDKVYLVAATSGSHKHNTTHYRVVLMQNGKLEATEITTDNRDAGWALKIRDSVATLLESRNGIG